MSVSLVFLLSVPTGSFRHARARRRRKLFRRAAGRHQSQSRHTISAFLLSPLPVSVFIGEGLPGQLCKRERESLPDAVVLKPIPPRGPQLPAGERR